MRTSSRIMLLGMSLVILSVLASCASIVSGTKQEISVKSTPTEAEVIVTGSGGQVAFTGKTPAVAELPRKSEYDVEIKLAGYQTETVHIAKGFNGWYLGNIICGGIIGLIVDAVNGAMYKLEPGEISVNLMTAQKSDGTTETYAVLQAVDAEHQLRTQIVPLQSK